MAKDENKMRKFVVTEPSGVAAENLAKKEGFNVRPVYARPQSDELRKAATVGLMLLDMWHSGDIVRNEDTDEIRESLRAALERK
jgi:hypothetical protein